MKAEDIARIPVWQLANPESCLLYYVVGSDSARRSVAGGESMGIQAYDHEGLHMEQMW